MSGRDVAPNVLIHARGEVGPGFVSVTAPPRRPLPVEPGMEIAHRGVTSRTFGK